MLNEFPRNIGNDLAWLLDKLDKNALYNTLVIEAHRLNL